MNSASATATNSSRASPSKTRSITSRLPARSQRPRACAVITAPRRAGGAGASTGRGAGSGCIGSGAASQGRREHGTVDRHDAVPAAERQHPVDVAPEDLEHAGDAGLASDRETPQMRPADSAGRGAERQRLDHVGAAPHAAVEQHRDAPGDGVDHRRQRADRGEGAVQLAAAVVGDDHAVDAVPDGRAGVLGVEHALDQQRAPPDAAQPVDVLPGRVGSSRSAT